MPERFFNKRQIQKSILKILYNFAIELIQFILKKILTVAQSIPKVLVKFFITITLLIVGWKILYLFILPPGLLDGPLTHILSRQTIWVLNLFGQSNEYSYEWDKLEDIILFKNKSKLVIADKCNGLELLLLYAALIIAIPSNIKRKLYFIFGGIILIHCVNVLRCCGLAILKIQNSLMFDFAHHFLFNFVIYSVMMVLWYWFAQEKKDNTNAI